MGIGGAGEMCGRGGLDIKGYHPRQVCVAWLRTTRDALELAEAREMQQEMWAAEQLARFLLARCVRHWWSFADASKLDRAAAEKRQQLWQKVNGWLSEIPAG